MKKRSEKQGRKGKVYSTKHKLQRTAWRDKKAFFNEQCIKIEENNRRRKTRDLIRKIVYIKGTFCTKMGKIKDRNSRDLVDTEEIKKRRKEYMEQLCTKRSSLYDDDVSHPEPDILEAKSSGP